MVDRDVVQNLNSPTCGEGKISSDFCNNFATGTNQGVVQQGGQRTPEVEALAKRSKSDDTVEQKVLLRRATESSDGGRVMVGLKSGCEISVTEIS